MYIWFSVDKLGSVTAACPNPAVSKEVLKDILTWKASGLSDEDVIDKLRTRMVPTGYTYHYWKQGSGLSCLACMYIAIQLL